MLVSGKGSTPITRKSFACGILAPGVASFASKIQSARVCIFTTILLTTSS